MVFMIIFINQTYGQKSDIFNIKVINKVNIKNEIKINTRMLESSPFIYGNKIGFLYGNGEDYNIAFAEVDEDGYLDNKKILGEKINTPTFEGPFSIVPDQNIMFFTRSNIEKKVRSKPTKSLQDSLVLTLRIMQVDLNYPKSTPKGINLNNETYNVCHPAIFMDGAFMVFSSDMPGGYGGLDLYIARWENGEWIGVKNLGYGINSSANDFFPSVLKDSILIFSSDRSGGFGGIDMYASQIENGLWSDFELLPKPFNSAFDDLGMVVFEDGKKGYFASNRPGGKGEDDIYRWETAKSIFKHEPMDEYVEVSVLVMDKLTLSPLNEVKTKITPLKLTNYNFNFDDPNIDLLSGTENGEVLFKLSSDLDGESIHLTFDSDGESSVKVKKSQLYLITSECNGYEQNQIIYRAASHGLEMNIVMEPDDADLEELEEEELEKEESDIQLEVGTVMVIENIFYQYNSYQIMPGSAKGLDTLIIYLNKNPNLRLLLEAHTDSRGTEQYNLLLSERRAHSAKEYLIANGIDESRISTKGYGETKLRNHCKNDVKCTEAEHRYNRRTEVLVLEK